MQKQRKYIIAKYSQSNSQTHSLKLANSNYISTAVVYAICLFVQLLRTHSHHSYVSWYGNKIHNLITHSLTFCTFDFFRFGTFKIYLSQIKMIVSSNTPDICAQCTAPTEKKTKGAVNNKSVDKWVHAHLCQKVFKQYFRYTIKQLSQLLLSCNKKEFNKLLN